MAPSSRTPNSSRQVVSVGGHRLTLTNLDKVLYPQTGTTKGDVLHYYAEMAPLLISHAADRPATRKRWVNGVGTIERPGNAFFNKDLDSNAPSWIKHYAIEHSNHTNDYPLINDLATLTWFAQLATLEFHVPQWKFGRGGVHRNPDRLVLDLDPGDGAGLPECIAVAKSARTILVDMGLDPMPVTSGSKGIHLYAALDGTQTSTQVTEVAHELARILESDLPDLVVSDMKKSLRSGKVLVDWSQNNANKTTVVPYSLRGRSRPMVAAPRTWRELDAAGVDHLDLDEMLKRMKRRKDPLATLLRPSSMVPLDAEDLPATDRLTTYRGKRDAAKTSEPVPTRTPVAGEGRSFVIQEHHARRLHFDFRLEHEGVLVSWALPKGVPIDARQNRLAVQTEDHPLEYGTFEGTIPKGEYGAGEVSIWDSGDYELEKWREGAEVIVTLHGSADGGLRKPRKFALIHTGGEGKADAHWLIHLMDAAAESGPRATSRKAQPSKPIQPMLASPGGPLDLDTGDEWAHEMKWDGIRAVVHINDSHIKLMSRNGNDMTATYPDLVDAIAAAVDTDAILDGEIVALDRDSRPHFGLLQKRMSLTKKADILKAAKDVPVHLMVFDVLAVDGESRRRHTYDQRREILTGLVRESDRGGVQVPPAFDGDFGAALQSSRDLGLEGIVAKKRESTYVVGRRSKAWIKVKHSRMQEAVIGGWRTGKGQRSSTLGSLLLGVPREDGTLAYVGRVGTGFGDKELDSLAAQVRRRSRKTSPFVDVPTADAADANWVTPNLVVEVEFGEWTASGRLRHPTWRGLRPDKNPAGVRRES